eukprot:6181956-Pleurochrysis_carterae.AAC.1
MSACRVSTAPAPFSREPTLREMGGRVGFPPPPALSVASPLPRSRPAAPALSVASGSSPSFLSARLFVGFASASFAASAGCSAADQR